ncbi:MAG TPA: hypothetical protein VGI40_05210 [Pirellulaceae bacterium]|jgi:hypothetical protein
MRTIQTALTLLACLLVLSQPSAADDNADELKRLEGRYERTFANTAGTQFKVIKEVVGDQSVVTTYDDVNNVIESHTSTIKVEKRGPVRVHSFFNLLVTAGPAKGEQQFETSSYIYRADDESFVEVWGMLEGDPSPPDLLEARQSDQITPSSDNLRAYAQRRAAIKNGHSNHLLSRKFESAKSRSEMPTLPHRRLYFLACAPSRFRDLSATMRSSLLPADRHFPPPSPSPETKSSGSG